MRRVQYSDETLINVFRHFHGSSALHTACTYYDNILRTKRFEKYDLPPR